jgi:hypothetical protein
MRHFACPFSPLISFWLLFSAIEIGEDLDTMALVEKWETIRDTNDLQARTLPSPTTGRFLKLTFEAATDFYGRITIYSLEVFGSQV